ncbi:MAG: helix-turn-helix transcriptional regulator [Clostridiaceae bacterium]|nr:helix-turn-helix transcriptional regulator [Clostridiaceae bacterium]
MSLGENIQFYRNKAGITQEQFAERLDVSRQSVSKWESNTTYPEMDKLLQMCGMFSCSLDTLLRGDAESVSFEDTGKYDQHMNGFARAITVGIALLFLGVAVLLMLLGFEVSVPLSVVAMLAFVVSAIMTMTYAGLGHDAYMRKHPQVKPFYSGEDIEAADRKFRLQITLGIGLLFLGVLWLVGSFALPIPVDIGRQVYVAIAILIFGIAVAIMSYSGMQKDKYDIDKYNQSNTPEARQAEKENDENSPVGKWCGAVFMIAIAVFLVLGLGWQMWHPGWIAFPAAIFLCAVGAIVGGKQGKKAD